MKSAWISMLLLGLFVGRQSASLPDGQEAQPAARADADSAVFQDLTLELISKVDPAYPDAAVEKKLSGEVLVKVRISESGDVESAQAMTGDPLLADAAVSAANRWKFKPFTRDRNPVKVSIVLPFNFKPPAKGPVIVKAIRADQAEQKASPTPTAVGAEPNISEKPVRVSPQIMQAFVIQRAGPVYPDAARRSKVQGAVVLSVVIGKDGQVRHMEVISGPEQLAQSAIETVRKWKYRPFVVDDEPVDVETTVTINYTIAG